MNLDLKTHIYSFLEALYERRAVYNRKLPPVSEDYVVDCLIHETGADDFVIRPVVKRYLKNAI